MSSENRTSNNPTDIEAFVTLKAAAEALQLPYFKIARAAQAGLFPTYTFFNKRKLCRISEVVDVIKHSAQS